MTEERELICERCTFLRSDWRHTMLCGSLDEGQEEALAMLVVLDAKAKGELPKPSGQSDA